MTIIGGALGYPNVLAASQSGWYKMGQILYYDYKIQIKSILVRQKKCKTLITKIAISFIY